VPILHVAPAARYAGVTGTAFTLSGWCAHVPGMASRMAGGVAIWPIDKTIECEKLSLLTLTWL
jgi:hypothetical protein